MIKSHGTILLIVFLLPFIFKIKAEEFPQQIKAYTTDSIDGQQVLAVAEVMPEFPGGDKELYKYITEKITYKNTCKEDFQTRVDVTFVIDTCGRVHNARILHPKNMNKFTPLEQSILDLINSIPDWQSGEQCGKKVPVKYMLPIRIDPQQN